MQTSTAGGDVYYSRDRKGEHPQVHHPARYATPMKGTTTSTSIWRDRQPGPTRQAACSVSWKAPVLCHGRRRRECAAQGWQPLPQRTLSQQAPVLVLMVNLIGGKPIADDPNGYYESPKDDARSLVGLFLHALSCRISVVLAGSPP